MRSAPGTEFTAAGLILSIQQRLSTGKRSLTPQQWRAAVDASGRLGSDPSRMTDESLREHAVLNTAIASQRARAAGRTDIERRTASGQDSAVAYMDLLELRRRDGTDGRNRAIDALAEMAGTNPVVVGPNGSLQRPQHLVDMVRALGPAIRAGRGNGGARKALAAAEEGLDMSTAHRQTHPAPSRYDVSVQQSGSGYSACVHRGPATGIPYIDFPSSGRQETSAAVDTVRWTDSGVPVITADRRPSAPRGRRRSRGGRSGNGRGGRY